MGLIDKAESTKRKRPYFICLYTEPGLGKSTFASESPSPFFIAAEDGLASLDVKAFKPNSYQEVLDVVDELQNTKHSYETLVIDTLDHLEKHVFATVCKNQEKNHIEDISYKRGYIFAVDEWRRLTDKLTKLREKMHVVLLAHSLTKNEKNPMGEDYMKYQMKIHEKSAALITEVVDALLFGRYEIFTRKEGSKVKAVGDGARVVHTESRPGFSAKNRYSLPETIPLSWPDFVAACESGSNADPAQLAEKIKSMLDAIKDDTLTQKVMELAKGADSVKLKKLIDKLSIRMEAIGG